MRSFKREDSQSALVSDKPVAHDCLAFIEILQVLKITTFITSSQSVSQVAAHSGPVVEQLGPVVGVGGGAEDVHHHEVLDVVLLSPRLLQLVDVIPAMQNIEYDNVKLCHTLSHLQILSIFLIMGMLTSTSLSPAGLAVEVVRVLSPG